MGAGRERDISRLEGSVDEFQFPEQIIIPAVSPKALPLILERKCSSERFSYYAGNISLPIYDALCRRT